MGDSTLPGCIGYLGFPLAPNGPCAKCGFRHVCKRMAALARIAEMEVFVGGAEVVRVSERC